MWVEKISKVIFANTVIKSHYLVSPEQSIQHYEWRFIPVNMTMVITSSSYPFSITPLMMTSSTKVTSTPKSSTMSMAKTTWTIKLWLMQLTEKCQWKKKQIVELSDEEDEEEKGKKNKNNNMEDDSKVNKIQKRTYKILTDSLQDLETAKANFFHCSIGKRN